MKSAEWGGDCFVYFIFLLLLLLFFFYLVLLLLFVKISFMNLMFILNFKLQLLKSELLGGRDLTLDHLIVRCPVLEIWGMSSTS